MHCWLLQGSIHIAERLVKNGNWIWLFSWLKPFKDFNLFLKNKKNESIFSILHLLPILPCSPARCGPSISSCFSLIPSVRAYGSFYSLSSPVVFHLLFPLPRMLFPLPSSWLPYSHPLSLGSNITSSEVFSWPPSQSLPILSLLSPRVPITICNDLLYTLTCCY